MIKKIIILGTGGNCLDIVDAVLAINQQSPMYEVLGFLDDDPGKQHYSYLGFPVLGSLKQAVSLAAQFNDSVFVNGIGSPLSFGKKAALISSIQIPNKQFATVIHPDATISPSATIESGTVVLANTTICANATIGHHVMILPGCTINHDCQIGDYAIMASGAVLCGNVQLESSCYVGASSVILGDVVIGTQSLVGAGAVATKDVCTHSVVCGNPAKPFGAS